MKKGPQLSKSDSAQESSHLSTFHTPLIWSKFSSFFDTPKRSSPFLGRTANDGGAEKFDFKIIYKSAKNQLQLYPDLSPSPQAIKRTQKAAVFFYQQAYAYCQSYEIPFPLTDLNKCIGFVALPKSKLVLIALSQDHNPAQDLPVRQKLVELIEAINQQQSKHTFELVKVPTKEQYLMLRALSAESRWSRPSEELIKPRTRCVEVALAVACNKVGNSLALTPQNLGMQAFGSGLWADAQTSIPLEGYQAKIRNDKYLFQNPLMVELQDNKVGWLDPWMPCPEHCQPFLKAIRALSLSGGPATSYSEPRSDVPICSNRAFL